jgi:eukaryotic-like serine/threonine-protein kinase
MSLRAPALHQNRAERNVLTPGAIIGHYEVISFLGEGSMGRVYRARDCGLRREVALKHISPAAGRSVTTAKQRLRREALAMAQVEHPAVIRLYEAFVCDDELFVVMELARGGTLAQWMADRRPTWREVIQVFLEAGHGLAAAHNVGLVHRDIKPSNILMDAHGRPRICDFGLARMFADATATIACTSANSEGDLDARITTSGAIAGTFPYMAPEQLTNGAIDARADQFAFCVGLWEALCGQRPFQVPEGAGSPDAFARAIAAGPVTGARSGMRVPRRVLAQVRRGLAADRNMRWPSMDVLLDALRRAASPRRSRWSAYAVIVAGIGVALFATTHSTMSNDGQVLSSSLDLYPNPTVGAKQILPDASTQVAMAQSGVGMLKGTFRICRAPEGTINSVSLLTSTGFSAYDEKIRNEIRSTWRYRPSLINGKPVPVCATADFVYKQY